MAVNTVRFVLLMLLALLVGTTFGILMGYNPAGLSAAAYIQQQQNAIRSLNTLLPVMGAVCIVLMVWLAIRSGDDRRGRVCFWRRPPAWWSRRWSRASEISPSMPWS